MTAGAIVLGVLGPALFWIAWLYYKDRYQPEPLWAIGLAYGLGLAAALVAMWGYEVSARVGLPEDPFLLAQRSRGWFLLYAVGFVGVWEELCKLVPFVLVVMRLCAFDEVIDGIIYASAIALGYASLENLLYLPELEGPALYGRAIAAPLVHTMFSSVWGLALARARIAGQPLWRPAVIGVAAAAVIHGLYDFVALSPVLQPAAAAVIAAVWTWRLWVISRLHRAHQRGKGLGRPEDGD